MNAKGFTLTSDRRGVSTTISICGCSLLSSSCTLTSSEGTIGWCVWPRGRAIASEPPHLFVSSAKLAI
jgi:hypothetical protein